MRQFVSILAIAAIVITKVSADSSDCIGSCSSSHIPYLPHKLCTKFCMCSQGSPIEVFCPPGLYFSPQQYVCVNPEDAHCQRSLPSIKNSGCLGECPPASADFNQIALLAHEKCDLYCQCTQEGIPLVESCADGLHFNIDYATCLEPELANCASSLS
ncbi:hypothetical protein KQX54_001634 [Cotesia glomerata]|uniref:Chitin-binding type-2 domain-containing protein n=1 Tax=Cotesia glomerata TaxID=32391 RepID=A0AAV7I8T3_COTGL|nr:hypothetical protein KQX54_001634 [Cotesia glomerata]